MAAHPDHPTISKLSKIIQPNTQTVDTNLLYKTEFIPYNDFVYQLSNFPNKLRIMTYNVKSYNYNHKYTKDNIIQEIYKVNPDILCLQEHLGEIYPLENYKYVVNCKSEHMFDNVIYSKFHIKTSKTIPIESSRCAILATIEYREGKFINIINTHLPLNSPGRIESIKKIVSEGLSNTLIVGDFNSYRKNDYNGEELHKLAELKKHHEYPNIFETTNYLEKIGYTDSFKSMIPPKNTSIYGGRVDFVYKSPDFMLPVIGSYVHYSDNSDHLPVIVDFYIDTSNKALSRYYADEELVQLARTHSKIMNVESVASKNHYRDTWNYYQYQLYTPGISFTYYKSNGYTAINKFLGVNSIGEQFLTTEDFIKYYTNQDNINNCISILLMDYWEIKLHRKLNYDEDYIIYIMYKYYVENNRVSKERMDYRKYYYDISSFNSGTKKHINWDQFMDENNVDSPLYNFIHKHSSLENGFAYLKQYVTRLIDKCIKEKYI